MITKSFSFEIKSVDEQGRFSGRAACYGNVDSDNEVIDPGCFKRSVQNSQGKVPILWSHDPRTPIGWGVSAKETDDSLWVEGQLMLNTQHGRLAYEYAKLGQSIGAANIGLSVGFRPVKDGFYVKEGQRHWKECQLLEYSYAVFPSNPQAGVTGVKNDESVLSLIVKSQDLESVEAPDLSDEQKASLNSLASLIKADKTAKTKRVSGKDLTSDQFAYVGDEEDTSTWKLPIHDAAHVRNALARFEQTDGIPDDERDAVMSRIKRAAKKFGVEVSDGKSAHLDRKSFGMETTEPMTFQAALDQENQAKEEREYRLKLEDARTAAISSITDSALDTADIKMALTDVYSAYSSAMVAWHMSMVSAATKAMSEVMAIKGMSTQDHMEMQTKLSRAKVQMEEAKAHQESANTLRDKAHKIATEAIHAYSATDIRSPNGPTAGPAPKLGKSEALDLSAILKSLSVQ